MCKCIQPTVCTLKLYWNCIYSRFPRLWSGTARRPAGTLWATYRWPYSRADCCRLPTSPVAATDTPRTAPPQGRETDLIGTNGTRPPLLRWIKFTYIKKKNKKHRSLPPDVPVFFAVVAFYTLVRVVLFFTSYSVYIIYRHNIIILYTYSAYVQWLMGIYYMDKPSAVHFDW